MPVNRKISLFKYPAALVGLFFVFYLVLGLSISKDYGLSHDEPINRINGTMTADYVLSGNQALFSWKDRFYGTFFESVLIIPEIITKRALDTKLVFKIRHLLTFLLFYLGTIFFYFLAKKQFRRRWLAVLGTFFLIASPRIFADSFYNSKDAGFLAFMIFGFYSLVVFLEKKNYPAALFHALTSAMATDVRVAGIILPFLTAGLLLGETWRASRTDRAALKKNIQLLMVYLILFAALSIFFWPYLWPRPLNNIIKALQIMSHYDWTGPVLYLGQYIKANQVPWHYIPVWILITTPPVCLLFFLIGFFQSLKSLAQKKLDHYFQNRVIVIAVLIFILPILTGIFMKAVFYDGWRQMYFIYPAFIILALAGFNSLWIRLKTRWPGGPLAGIIAAGILVAGWWSPLYFMVKYHPYQNVYFNKLAGRSLAVAKKNFELDYWGLSYLPALEYIFKNDAREPVRIIPANFIAYPSILMLGQNDQKRLVWVDSLSQADYLVTNYRWHIRDYSFPNEVFSIKVADAKIVSVFKLR